MSMLKTIVESYPKNNPFEKKAEKDMRIYHLENVNQAKIRNHFMDIFRSLKNQTSDIRNFIYHGIPVIYMQAYKASKEETAQLESRYSLRNIKRLIRIFVNGIPEGSKYNAATIMSRTQNPSFRSQINLYSRSAILWAMLIEIIPFSLASYGPRIYDDIVKNLSAFAYGSGFGASIPLLTFEATNYGVDKCQSAILSWCLKIAFNSDIIKETDIFPVKPLYHPPHTIQGGFTMSESVLMTFADIMVEDKPKHVAIRSGGAVTVGINLEIDLNSYAYLHARFWSLKHGEDFTDWRQKSRENFRMYMESNVFYLEIAKRMAVVSKKLEPPDNYEENSYPLMARDKQKALISYLNYYEDEKYKLHLDIPEPPYFDTTMAVSLSFLSFALKQYSEVTDSEVMSSMTGGGAMAAAVYAQGNIIVNQLLDIGAWTWESFKGGGILSGMFPSEKMIVINNLVTCDLSFNKSGFLPDAENNNIFISSKVNNSYDMASDSMRENILDTLPLIKNNAQKDFLKNNLKSHAVMPPLDKKKLKRDVDDDSVIIKLLSDGTATIADYIPGKETAAKIYNNITSISFEENINKIYQEIKKYINISIEAFLYLIETAVSILGPIMGFTIKVVIVAGVIFIAIKML